MDKKIITSSVDNKNGLLLNNTGITSAEIFGFILMFSLSIIFILAHIFGNTNWGIVVIVIPFFIIILLIWGIIIHIPNKILISDDKIVVHLRFGKTYEFQWDQLDRIVSSKPTSSWFTVMFSIPSPYPEYHPPSTKGFNVRPEIGALLNRIKYDKLSISEVKSNYDYLLSTEPEFNPIHERERIMETLPMANTVFYLHFGFIPIPFTAYYRGVIPIYILIIIYIVWTISLIYVFRMKRKLRSDLVSLSTVINNAKETDD